MRNARPLILILLAVFGVMFGIFYASKKMGAKAPPAVEKRRVVVAIEPISYGRPLVLKGTKAEGQKANIAWVDWPANLLPEGVIKDQAVLDKGLVARDDFTKGEPLLEAKVEEREVFSYDPEVMYPEEFPIDPGLIQKRMIGLDDRVDVLYVKGGREEVIIECAEIYALGGTIDGLPIPDVDISKVRTVSLLLPVDKYREVRSLKGQYGNGLTVVKTQSETGEGPRFPTEGETVDTTAAMAALSAQQARERALDDAKALAGEGKLAEAIEALRTAEGIQAAALVLDWEARQLSAILDRAQEAYDAADYDAADEALAELDSVNDAARRARTLRESLADMRAGRAKLENYSSLLVSIQTSIDEGALGGASAQIEKLQSYVDEQYDPGAGVSKPAEVLPLMVEELEKRKTTFELEDRILRHHLANKRCDRAREKLNAMKQAFPKHEDIPALEALVEKCELGE